MFIEKFIGMYLISFATLVAQPLHHIYDFHILIFFFYDYNLRGKPISEMMTIA